ncbi:unnamed protein product [Sphagnum jensenii]|uniref:Uncharacterized protein n=2 Tax=Sphagnum jensenii TaxID=128206 RepID=A0ABP0ZYU4_9BRYO
MSVAYRRWELGGGAPGVGYNKKITGSPAQVHHHQYGSVDGTAVLRRQQQQHQQQHQPHEPCNLSSFSIYMQQCPSAASAGTTATAAVAATTTGKLQVMAATHSTLSLPDHQAAAAQEKAEEVERWGMMQMGHAGMGGCGHKLPVTSMRLSSSNVPRQFCSVQGGLSLMMNPPLKGEESAAPTTAEACTTATTATPDALQRVHEVSHTASSRGVVVGVFLPEEQCMKKKQELLPLAASSSPSSSSSSICDGREQSSCSSQEDTCGDVEAQSAYRGPLDQMSALESSLPIKRPGLSKFFGGKSRSFSSLADVSSVSDLAKPNNPYAKRRRLGLNSSLDRHRSYPPISRASVAGISKKSSNRSSTLTVAVKLGSLTEEDKNYAAALPGSRISGTRTTPSRSFSLTDLPVVSNPSSPPSRRSFAHP